MIRNTQLICLITLCLDIMIYNTYGQAAPESSCNICNKNEMYIKHPDNQVDVTFLGFDDSVQDMISCQQIYDAGMTHYISEEQCKLIHTHENGIQLQKLCGCTSETVEEEVTDKRLSSSTTLESSTSQLKVLKLIKQPEIKINIDAYETINGSSDVVMTSVAGGGGNGGKLKSPPVVMKPSKIIIDTKGKPVIASAPVYKKSKIATTVATPTTTTVGKPVIASAPVFKKSKISPPISMTVVTPTTAVQKPVIASAPLFKKSKIPSVQAMSTTTSTTTVTKPNIVMKQQTIKIKDINGGKV